MNWSDVMHFPLVTPIDIWNDITRTDFLIPNVYWVPVFMIVIILFGSRVHRRRVERNRKRREAEAYRKRFYEANGYYPEEMET
jgi:hypothetical protein